MLGFGLPIALCTPSRVLSVWWITLAASYSHLHNKLIYYKLLLCLWQYSRPGMPSTATSDWQATYCLHACWPAQMLWASYETWLWTFQPLASYGLLDGFTVAHILAPEFTPLCLTAKSYYCKQVPSGEPVIVDSPLPDCQLPAGPQDGGPSVRLDGRESEFVLW